VRLLIFITVVLRRIRQVDPQMRVMRNGPVGLIWRNANVAQQSSLQDCCAMTTAKRNRTFRARPTQAVQQQARSPRVRGEINVRYKQAGLRKTNALLSISKACQAGSRWLSTCTKFPHRRVCPSLAFLISRCRKASRSARHPRSRDRRCKRWRDIPIPGRPLADPDSEPCRVGSFGNSRWGAEQPADRRGHHCVGSKLEMYRV
jgi:hypothetical protein